MKFLTASLCALVASAAAVLPASAGWDNVFQPTLFERFRKPKVVTQYVYVPPVVTQSAPVVVAQSAPCEDKKCTTQYIQRSYYQPVTTYETREVKELVTTQRTSYYYAPVTTYRYSSYYDPCTCSYTQVAVPATSYELRAQSCPVQSWVSRCVQVPVQGYQKVDYWQPQTTCCTTTLGAPIIGSQPPQMPPAAPIKDGPPEIRGTQGAGPQKSSQWEQYYPPLEKAPEIRTPGTSFQPQLGFPIPFQTNSPPPVSKPQPPVKLDRIAVGPDSRVEGQVTRSDSSPKPNAKLLFVNASSGQRQSINANSAGRFQINLPTGSWHVYLHGTDDLPIYHSRVDVSGAQFRQVNLVSRSN